MVDTFHDFQTVLASSTKNFECLVMDNTDSTGELDKQLFYFKAPMSTPQFTLGKEIYWSMDQQFRKSRQNTEEMLYRRLAATAQENGQQDGAKGKRLIVSR